MRSAIASLTTLLVVSLAIDALLPELEAQPVPSSPVPLATSDPKASPAAPAVAGEAPDHADEDEPRHPDLQVVLIMSWNYPGAEAKLRELEAFDGAFEHLRKKGWRVGTDANANLRIVSVDQMRSVVDAQGIKVFPAVCSMYEGKVIRSFTSGCTTPLDEHTFEWLRTGTGTRPITAPMQAATVASTGHYPLRGGHWSVDGDWTPPLNTVVHHLRGPNHRSLIPRDWAIESWSYEELRSLHDDLHESGHPRSLESGGRQLAGSTASSYSPAGSTSYSPAYDGSGRWST